MYRSIYLFIITSTTLTKNVVCQSIDTSATRHDSSHANHSHYIEENVPKSKLWGNSWYTAIAFTYNRSNAYDLNIGRTYGVSSCSGGGCMYSVRSWGAGYEIALKNDQPNHVAKAFWEYSFFYCPPLSVGVRGDYMYDISNNTHYIRPSAGLSFIWFDLLYNYSLKLAGTHNLYGHGVTLRLKYFHKSKNWQRNHPSKC